MKRRLLAVATLLACSSAHAQTIVTGANGFISPMVTPAYGAKGAAATPVSTATPLPVTIISGGGGGGDASAANQTAVQADAGSDATKAVAVQGVTGGKALSTSSAQSGTWTVQPGNTANTTPWLVTPGGDTAHDAVDTGNPIKIGGKANTAAPTGVAVGDRVNAWFNTNGAQITTLASSAGTIVGAISPTNPTSTVFGLATHSQGQVYNGSVWYNAAGDATGTYAVGGVAHDAADTGSPIKIGGKAVSAVPADVTANDRVNALFGLDGRQFVQPMGGTIGGLSVASNIVANNTTSVAIKASAGTLYGVTVFNNSATIAYLKLYNTAQGSVTCGSGTPVQRIMIPASTSGAGTVVSWPLGVAYSTAITSCITAGFADNDTTAPAASTYLAEFTYK